MLDAIENYLTLNDIDNIYISTLPDSPDNCVGLFVDAGNGSEVFSKVDFPSIRILVRDKVYLTGYEKANKIRSLLHGTNDLTDTEGKFLVLKAKSVVLSIGLDNKKRHQFSINFDTVYCNN